MAGDAGSPPYVGPADEPTRRANCPQKKRGKASAKTFPLFYRNQNAQQFLLQWNSSSIQYSNGMAFFIFSMRAFSFSLSIAWRRI